MLKKQSSRAILFMFGLFASAVIGFGWAVEDTGRYILSVLITLAVVALVILSIMWIANGER